MRISWHRSDHREVEVDEPAWVSGRPVETAGSVKIAAKTASELVHHDEIPHIAA